MEVIIGADFMSILDKIRDSIFKFPKKEIGLKETEELAIAMAKDTNTPLQKAFVSNSSKNLVGSNSLAIPGGISTYTGTTISAPSLSDTFSSLNLSADSIEIGSSQFNNKTKLNSKVTILENVVIFSKNKVPNKFIQWFHKNFFNMTWEDISCAKCVSKLSCLVNTTFEANCKIK